MRGAILFLSGAVVGVLVTTSLAAQGALNTGLRLNHVGFRVSHRFAPNPDGRPGTAFVQISRDTFIEIAPAAPDAKPTITHLGIGADDIKATVARLTQKGGKPTEPRPSANSGSILANITDPAGIRTELNEQPPGSMMRQAIDSWK